MKKMQTFSDEEADNVLIKLENMLIKNGIVYQEEFAEMCAHLSEKSKRVIASAIQNSGYAQIDDEGIIKYIPREFNRSYDSKEILKDILKPDFVHATPDYVQVGRTYYKGIIATKFPTNPGYDWLEKVVSERSNVDYALFMTEADLSELKLFLKRELVKVENELYTYEKKGRANPELERKKEELIGVMTDIGREFYEFKIALFIVVKGNSIDEVNNLKSYVTSTLKGEDIAAEDAKWLHEYVLKAVIPNGLNRLKKSEMMIPDTSLGAAFPFMHPFQIISDQDETILGFNENDLIITGNVWRLSSYSGAYIGQTGGGKSLALKYELFQQMSVSDVRVIVIDPAAAKVKDDKYKPEYYRMCQLLGGRYISFSTDSENIPNVMATFEGEKFEDEMRRIYSIVRVFFEDENKIVPEPQKPLIQSAVVEAFRRRKITKNSKELWKLQQPKLEDLLWAFKKGLADAKTEATRMSYEALIKRLEPCTGNGLRSYLNTDAKEEAIDKQFVVFEFKDTPVDDTAILIMRMLSYIKRVMQNWKRTIIVLEEAHLWLKDPYLSDFITGMEITARKTNTGIRLVFQDLGQLQGCKEGLTLLGNLAFVYLFKTASKLIPLTKESFGLNDTESKVIETSSKPGQDPVILIWDRDHYKVRIRVDPETYKIVTTNPEELRKIEESDKRSKIDTHTLELLENDLGYKPTSLETGMAQLVNKIKDKPHLQKVIKLYPDEYKKVIMSQLSRAK